MSSYNQIEEPLSCCFYQMENIESASVNVETWTLVNHLDEGGFPALLWDTLKDFGYTA
jgi:hypothetical protein